MSAGKKVSGPLTVQEQNVLELVAGGKTNKEIACDLKISPATVKRHLENILGKLQLRNRVEAAVFAVRVENFNFRLRKPQSTKKLTYGPFDA